MAATQLQQVLQKLRRAMFVRDGGGLTDGQLLECFVSEQNDAAFEVLVRRHGPMVLRVCRRVLRHAHDSEDAFQATFLVLARKAGSIRQRELVGNWLYGVAYRAALEAKANRRRVRESQVSDMPEPEATGNVNEWRELRPLLDRELDRLPEKYRVPIVLCDLEGRTRKEVAQQLGIPEGTLSGRLTTARRMLAKRLASHRPGFSDTALATALVQAATPVAMPSILVKCTVKAVAGIAAGQTLAGLTTPKVAAVTQGVLKTMLLAKLKPAALVLLLVKVLIWSAAPAALGGLLLGAYWQSGSANIKEATGEIRPRVTAKVPITEPSQKPAVGKDIYGDPLPPGAVARLGSLLFRHDRYVMHLAFSADGKTLISTGTDRTIRFWDHDNAKLIRAIKLEGSAGMSIQRTLSPDGKLFVGWDEKAITFWDAETGKQLKQLRAPTWKGRSGFLFFSQDGQTLGTADAFLMEVKLWHLKDNNETALKIPMRDGEYHSDSSAHICVSPNGKLLAIGRWSGEELTVWDVATGRKLYSLDAGATVSRFSSDGKILAVASVDKKGEENKTTLRLYDTANGKEIRQIPLAGSGRFGDLCWEIGFSPDGKVIIPVSRHGIYLLDIATGQELQRIGDWQSDGQRVITLSPDGRLLASANGGQIHLWDVATGMELHQRPGANEQYGIAYSPDGGLLAFGSWVGPRFSIWDTATGKRLRLLKTDREDAYVRNLSFTGDGQTMVVGDFDGHIDFLDAVTGRLLRTIELPKSEYRLYSLSFDRRRAVTANRDFRLEGFSTIKVWDTNSTKVLAAQTFDFVPAQGWVALGERAAFLTPEGIVIAGDASRQFSQAKPKPTIGRKGNFVEVDSGGGELFRLLVPGDWSAPLAVTGDHQLLAALAKPQGEKADPTSKAITVHVWEVRTGKEVAKLTTGPIDYMALAPDGRTLITVDAVSLRVWDIATGKVRYHITFPEDFAVPGDGLFVRDLCLSPDFRLATTPLRDGTLLVWQIPPRSRPAGPAKDQIGDDDWTQLAAEDAAIAYDAVWKLVDAPGPALKLLGNYLKPIKSPDAAKVGILVRDLDSDKFAIREAAVLELEKMGRAVMPTLREALTAKQPLETHRRLEVLLAKLSSSPLSLETLRYLRAIHVLAQIGTPDARDILNGLASGAPGARETEEAKAALERLGK